MCESTQPTQPLRQRPKGKRQLTRNKITFRYRAGQKTVHWMYHLAHMAVAADPINAHFEFQKKMEELEKEEEVKQSGSESMSAKPLMDGDQEVGKPDMGLAKRWQKAFSAIKESGEISGSMDTLRSRKATGKQKFASAVTLEAKLANNPNKTKLAQALQKKHEDKYTSLSDRFMNEMFITGERIFRFFTPGAQYEHNTPFTIFMVCSTVITFFFMCGEFQWYMMSKYGVGSKLGIDENCLDIQDKPYPFGPKVLLAWLTGDESVPWCILGVPEDRRYKFPHGFIVTWGARFGPMMKGQFYRWFTSQFVHSDFSHILGNTLLFTILSYQLEVKYGWWRITFLWLVGLTGANFFSAAFEKPCMAICGSSGGIFSLIGLYIADLIINFETIRRPIFRALVMIAFMIFFVVTVAQGGEATSHLSHAGGFVMGLFPAFLFLPSLKSEAWENFLPFIGGGVIIAVFVSLPIYVYKAKYTEEALDACFA